MEFILLLVLLLSTFTFRYIFLKVGFALPENIISNMEYMLLGSRQIHFTSFCLCLFARQWSMGTLEKLNWNQYILRQLGGHPRASMMSPPLAYPMPSLSVCVPSHPTASLYDSARPFPMSLASSTPQTPDNSCIYCLPAPLPSPFSPGQGNSSVKLLVAFCFFPQPLMYAL